MRARRVGSEKLLVFTDKHFFLGQVVPLGGDGCVRFEMEERCVPELWEVSQRVQVCWAEFCGIGASDFHKKNKAMELCLVFV